MKRIIILFVILLNGSISVAQLISAAQVCQLPLIANESSGVVKAGPNSFWTHNDSGGLPELYEFDSSGTLLRTLSLSGATNVDWEDLAMDSAGYIYIGDVGNNFNFRQELKIFKIPPPSAIIGNIVSDFDTIWFHYADQTQFPPPLSQWNYDLEAMTIIGDSIYLFTKNRTNPATGYSRVYTIPAVEGNYAADLRDSIFTGTGTIDHYGITGAASNADGSTLVLISNLRTWIFNGYSLPYFSQGTVQTFEFANPSAKEAVTFGNDSTIWMTSEGSPTAAGFLYRLDSASLFTAVTEMKVNQMSVYPNPFIREILITSEQNLKNVTLSDFTGKIIMTKKIQGKEFRLLTDKALTSGLYMLYIETTAGLSTFRVIKQ